MRPISISTPVFSAIWARRMDGEESEDQILSRILGVSQKSQLQLRSLNGKQQKMRWIDDVLQAFDELGGEAPLHVLYDKVRTIRAAAGRTLPTTTDAIVRREVENHSSDSEAYLGKRDLFYAPNGIGAGIWALR